MNDNVHEDELPDRWQVPEWQRRVLRRVLSGERITMTLPRSYGKPPEWVDWSDVRTDVGDCDHDWVHGFDGTVCTDDVTVTAMCWRCRMVRPLIVGVEDQEGQP